METRLLGTCGVENVLLQSNVNCGIMCNKVEISSVAPKCSTKKHRYDLLASAIPGAIPSAIPCSFTHKLSYIA